MKFNRLTILYRKALRNFFKVYSERDHYRELSCLYARFNPPGHYYSPVPAEKDIPDFISIDYYSEIPGIDMRDDAQKDLLEELKHYYCESIFPHKREEGIRYYFDNDYFGYSDGIFLSAIMRHFKPKRIIEIGSGYSSALMLEVNEKYLNNCVKLTFIEPFPEERLINLLKPDEKCSVIKDFVQNIKIDIWQELEENDILFIDSSHVVKFGSDVQHLLAKVIPLLRRGVIIHIHDIFFPFEYPVEWLKEGRAWNETYFIRTFLQFNTDFEILLFSSFLEGKYSDWFEKNMPFCLKIHKKLQLEGKEVLLSTNGQSIYIRRR